MRPRAAALLLAIVGAGLLALPAAGAANTLSDPHVSPPSGTTATVFDFRVRYTGFAPDWVVARVAGLELPLQPAPGEDPLDGIYHGSGSLPAGEHQVEFVAQVSQGNAPPPVSTTVTVTDPATASPLPTSPPAQPPTPAPTATAPPTPSGATRSPSATAIAPTPLPPIGTVGPGGSPPGAAGPSDPPLASGFVGGVVMTPSEREARSPAPAVAQARDRQGGGGPWTLLGGGMLGIALLVVLAMVGLLRTRRELPAAAPASAAIAATDTPLPRITWEDDYEPGVASLAPAGDDVIRRS
ncbi:MAG TPA: hypothetical protein VFH63_04100 [candidate division Zixibacteria bacterium]|nr:hypothetical protein [candidate division Zixibacteria bacterium]